MNYHSIYNLPKSVEKDATIEALYLNANGYDILALKLRFPNVKRIKLGNGYSSNYSSEYQLQSHTLQQLCDAYLLEELIIINAQKTNIPNSLWTSNLRNLYIRNYSNKSFDLPTHFDNQLETIYLSCDHNQGRVSPNLFQSPRLKKVVLSGVQDGLAGIQHAPLLESLTIRGYLKTQLDFELKPLNQLQQLVFQRCTFNELTNLNYCTKLTELILIDLPHLRNLPKHWDVFQQIQTIKLHHLGNCNGNNFIFNELPLLKKLHINQLTLTNEQAFLGNMPALESMSLAKINIRQLPTSIGASTQLAYLFIEDCPQLTTFPDAFWNHPKLSVLLIEKCPNLYLPKEILIKSSLKKFSYDFSRCHPYGFAKAPQRTNFLSLLEAISVEERLLLGQFLLEDFAISTDWAAFKKSLFSLLNATTDLLKAFIMGNLHLMNPKSSHLSVEDFEGKSIAFVGEPQLPKLIYKEKLIALRFDYQENAHEMTDCLVVTDPSKLDINCCLQSHYFFTEQQLIHFLQHADAFFAKNADFTEQLRALLWANEASNDILVFSILEGIQIPKGILPDLVAVVQESSDELVKDYWEQLLRFYIPQNVFDFLTANPPLLRMRKRVFQKHLASMAPFDVAQMAVCQYKRTRNRRYLYRFFESFQYQNNPYRKEMFDSACERFVELTNDVIDYFLEHYTFEKIKLNLFDELFPRLLFQHTTLISLTICFKCELLPTEITQLVYLKSLYINRVRHCAIKLKTLPINLLDMHTLEELIVFTYRRQFIGRTNSTPLPTAFKAWGAQLKVFQIHPTPIYREASVKAIRLDYFVAVDELEYRFPNIKEVVIDFDTTRWFSASGQHDYLVKLCDAFVWESFEVRRMEAIHLPQSLWTNQLKIIKLNLHDNHNLIIEIPEDFDNRLETIEITGQFHKIPPALFRSSTIRTIKILSISDEVSDVPNMRMLNTG